MRLLRLTSSGTFKLERFPEDQLPSYAILSHTWLQKDEEVMFGDIAQYPPEILNDEEDRWTTPGLKRKKGYKKIQFCARRALEDGLSYLWVDTCCINKLDNIEVTEAINSMFRWYQKATKCYVYVSDVYLGPSSAPDGEDWKLKFERSRCSTRDWTFQEPHAPLKVEFLANGGEMLGTRPSLRNEISQITGIGTKHLAVPAHFELGHVSVEELLSRFVERRTAGVGDIVYALLGLLDVSMPIRYGEGTAAFQLFEVAISRKLTVGMEPKRTFGSITDHQEGSRQDTQGPKSLVNLDHRTLGRPAKSLNSSEYDWDDEWEAIETPGALRLQQAAKWVAKLPVFPSTWLDARSSSDRVGDAKQSLPFSFGPYERESASTSIEGLKSVEWPTDWSGDFLNIEIPGAGGMTLQRQAVKSSISTCDSLIGSWMSHHGHTKLRGDLDRSFWLDSAQGALNKVERRNSAGEDNAATELEIETVEDGETTTQWSDRSCSTSETSSDIDDDEEQTVLDVLVDVLVEQIIRRACMPTAAFHSPGVSHSHSRKAFTDLRNKQMEAGRGHKRQAEHMNQDFMDYGDHHFGGRKRSLGSKCRQNSRSRAAASVRVGK